MRSDTAYFTINDENWYKKQNSVMVEMRHFNGVFTFVNNVLSGTENIWRIEIEKARGNR